MTRATWWAAVALLATGTAASLLVKTVWAVPLALVSSDPRLVGAALILAGLIAALVSSVWHDSSGRARRNRSLPILAAVALVVPAWVYLTSAYDLEDVEFENHPAVLRGTLVLPRGEGPHPAVVFVHGSGPERRGVSFHFADQFARAGVAALIYDKRGTGKSAGGHPRDPYRDLASDAMAAVGALQKHPSVDRDRIGLWGISEGGWTAPMAASMNSDSIAFLVIVSGGGAAPENEELYSIRTLLQERDIPPSGIDKALDLRRRINEYYRTGQGREELLGSIRQVEDSDWFVSADWYLPTASEVYEYGTEQWRRHIGVLDFDALPLLDRLGMPMLFIHGELDSSYPAEFSARRLEPLASDPTRDVSVLTYPDADHAIMIRRLPWPRYANGYVRHMVDWVAERMLEPR